MKLTYKNTALGLLDDPKKFPFFLAEDSKGMTEPEREAFGRSVRLALCNSEISDLFKQNVRYVSQPFYEAYLKSRSKLNPLLTDEPIFACGTLIFSKPPFTTTTFYAIMTDFSQEDYMYNVIIMQFSKHSKNDFINMDVMITDTKESLKEFIWSGFTKQGINAGTFISENMGLLLFLKYCEVETKIIKGNRKDTHVGVKYVNETKNNIEILDSTWFTTIIRSEGFGVRGHFRFQAYGPGMGQKKLIYIQPFEKEGYTRKAKILNQHSDEQRGTP